MQLRQKGSSFKKLGKRKLLDKKGASGGCKKAVMNKSVEKSEVRTQESKCNGNDKVEVVAVNAKRCETVPASSTSRKRRHAKLAVESDDEIDECEKIEKKGRLEVVPTEKRIKKVAVRPSVKLGKAELSSLSEFNKMKHKNKFGMYMELLCLMMDVKCRL